MGDFMPPLDFHGYSIDLGLAAAADAGANGVDGNVLTAEDPEPTVN